MLVALELVTRIPGLLISGVPVEFPWVSFTEAFFRSASVCAAEGSSVNRLGIRPWGGRNDGLIKNETMTLSWWYQMLVKTRRVKRIGDTT